MCTITAAAAALPRPQSAAAAGDPAAAARRGANGARPSTAASALLARGRITPAARAATGPVVAYWGWPDAAAVLLSPLGDVQPPGSDAPAGAPPDAHAAEDVGCGGLTPGAGACAAVVPGTRARWRREHSFDRDSAQRAALAGGDERTVHAEVARLLSPPPLAPAGPHLSGGRATPAASSRQRGTLTAACVMWAAASDAAYRPPLRQSLTYEEVLARRGHVGGGGDA